jgi:predicted dehydrogenase
VQEHPGEIELAALCDLRREHAETMAARYGFARVYTDLAEMLRRERPDGCIAVTPIPITPSIAAQVMRAGIPLMMEKPPADTVAEARQVAELAERLHARVMVSVNRRFDPALRAAQAAWGERPIEYLRASIVRVNRREPEFITGTAIHALDTMRAIAGDIQEVRSTSRTVDGVRWYLAEMTFASGAWGVLEVAPSAGSVAETQEWFGAGARCLVRTGTYDAGTAQIWEAGKLILDYQPAPGTPEFVRNGAYAEACAFIAALRERRALYPTPAQVLQSVEVCHQIAASANSGQ